MIRNEKQHNNAVKKDGVLKQQYKEMPRFPRVMNGYEEKLKKDYSTTLNEILKGLKRKFNTFTNE